MIELPPLAAPSLPSRDPLPSDSLLKHHLLDIQNVSVLIPSKLKWKPLQDSCQSNFNPMSWLMSHYSWLLYPNSPTRQTGIIIVLGKCVALGWGHVISSLVLPITLPWWFRGSSLTCFLMKAPAQNHPPLGFQRIHGQTQSCCSSCLAPLGCCFIWLLQFSLFILSRVPPWPQKWFTAGAPYLGIHNWNGYSFILSIISTFWLREFEWVSVPCKQTHLEGDGCHMCMLKIGMPSLRRGYFSQIWKLKVLSINALKVHLRHLFKSKDSKDADSRLHPILITKVAL